MICLVFRQTVALYRARAKQQLINAKHIFYNVGLHCNCRSYKPMQTEVMIPNVPYSTVHEVLVELSLCRCQQPEATGDKLSV